MHEGTFYTVLITATRMQHTQQADIKLIWADLYDFVLGIIDNFDNHERFLLEQLTFFLTGIGKNGSSKHGEHIGIFSWDGT